MTMEVDVIVSIVGLTPEKLGGSRDSEVDSHYLPLVQGAPDRGAVPEVEAAVAESALREFYCRKVKSSIIGKVGLWRLRGKFHW